MAEKAERPWTIAPLQRLVARPITSRTRQRALDKARKEQRETLAGADNAARKSGARKSK